MLEVADSGLGLRPWGASCRSSCTRPGALDRGLVRDLAASDLGVEMTATCQASDGS